MILESYGPPVCQVPEPAIAPRAERLRARGRSRRWGFERSTKRKVTSPPTFQGRRHIKIVCLPHEKSCGVEECAMNNNAWEARLA
jgi:hypothetical protein